MAQLIGEIIAYGGGTVPNLFLLCDGSAVSRTTYAELFAIVGTTFGAGNGTTTFNIPNMQGRIPVGWKTGDADFGTVGNYKGANTINLSHTHTANNHTHTASGNTNAGDSSTIYASSVVMTYGGHTHTYSGTTGAQSDTGMDTLLSATQSNSNPFVVVNFLIRYKYDASAPAFLFHMV